MERSILRVSSALRLPPRLRGLWMPVLAMALITLAGCERGTEPLDTQDLVGDYELVLVDGFSLPIDVWQDGVLSLRPDSTYTMVINDEIWDAGTWTVDGSVLTVSATRGFGAPWTGYIQPHAILFPKDLVHNYNDYLFSK